MWATLYNRIGVVKRHLRRRRFLFFPSWEVFVFVLAFAFAFRSSTKARFQNLGVDHLVPPAIYSVTELPTMIRCSDSPTARGGKALQSA